ncbi:hypothetical protein SK128_024681, partial [Halocaridina rubra]
MRLDTFLIPKVKVWQSMVQLQPTKVRKPPDLAYSVVSDQDGSQLARKERNDSCTNVLGIIVGLILTACILYVAVHGRALIMYPKCYNEYKRYRPNSLKDHSPINFNGNHSSSLEKNQSGSVYISPHGTYQELLNVKDYAEWVARLESKTSSSSLMTEPLLANREDLSSKETDKQLNKAVVFRSLKKSLLTSKNQCIDIPLSLRYDCLPGGTVDKDTCANRGCCWQPVDELPQRAKPHPSLKWTTPSQGRPKDLPLNIPFCYYPSDYDGYRFVNFSNNSGFLERETESGYPYDIPLLKIEFFYETETRLRIKIQDAEEVRWEAPLPVKPKTNHKSKPKFVEDNALYKIDIKENDATFAITRRDTMLPLFDTRNAAPLIYADQFLQISTHLPSEYIYGLGEHLNGLLLDTFWTRHVLWNLDQIPEPGKNLYGSHPFYMVMEPNGYAHGVFLHNSNAMDVVLQPSPALTFRTIGGILDIYVFLGPTPSDVVRQYTEVIGRPFLPPYWSLGYHQCRYNYKSVNNTRAVWQRTRDAGIPFDVQWNDIDYMDQNKDFTYDRENYKDLPSFVEEMHQVGMHYIPIIDPGISAAEPLHTYPPWDEGVALNIFVKNASGMPFIGKVWNPVATTWPDFTHPTATYYWGRQLLRYHSWVQIDGVWIDMNEPSNFWSGSYDGCPSSNIENPPYVPHIHGDVLYYHTVCMSARQQVGLHYNVHNLYGFTETISTN